MPENGYGCWTVSTYNLCIFPNTAFDAANVMPKPRTVMSRNCDWKTSLNACNHVDIRLGCILIYAVMQDYALGILFVTPAPHPPNYSGIRLS